MMVSSWREAMDIALQWAGGEKSHINEYISVEQDPADRPSTMAMASVADASEVRAWSAIAEGFASREREARRT